MLSRAPIHGRDEDDEQEEGPMKSDRDADQSADGKAVPVSGNGCVWTTLPRSTTGSSAPRGLVLAWHIHYRARPPNVGPGPNVLSRPASSRNPDRGQGDRA